MFFDQLVTRYAYYHRSSSKYDSTVSGCLNAGDPLPSVRTIVRELDINHPTVSKACSLLRTEGVVARIRGKGIVVPKTAVDPLAAIKPQVVALVETVRRLGPGCLDLAAVVNQVGANSRAVTRRVSMRREQWGPDLGATS